jgi:Leucine-rich repeat (LRR) protein
MDNQIQHIYTQAFKGFTSLQTLDLNNNQLTALQVGLFVGLNSLQYLLLKNNQLSQDTKGRIRQALPNVRIHF